MNLVLPPRCLGCAAIVEAQGTICATCWAQLDFITAPFCARCGLPFEVPAEPGTECGACIADPPPFNRHRTLWAYGPVSRALVLGLKHGDQIHTARPLAGFLARAAPDLFDSNDVLVPVPLHKWRLLRRRFNQSAVIAMALSKQTGLPTAPQGLERQRATRSQGGLTAEQRRRNVTGAFAVPARQRPLIEGQRVLLIDDVYTTGATLRACCRALINAGAAQIDALTVARVL